MTQRENSLDLLRGVAAVTVVVAHTTIIGLYKVEPYWTYLKWSPLRVLWAGHQAVILFFVLSGFALTRMLEGLRGRPYFFYLAARVARLYPPYLVSLVLAVATYGALQIGGFSWKPGWLDTVQPVLSWRVVIDHLAMIGTFETSTVNPPIWSLVHEMRLSIVFPWLLVAVLRWGWRVLCVAVAFSAAFAFACWNGKPAFLSWQQLSLVLTAHYATFFLLGSLMARAAQAIAQFFGQLGPTRRLALWCVALALYAYPFDNPWTLGQRGVGDLLSGVGCAGLVGLALSMRSSTLLRTGRWLGDISYSLYLNHVLVLNIVLITLYGTQPLAVLWMVTLAGSLVLATFLHSLVEAPAKAWSRRLRVGVGGVSRLSVLDRL